MRKIKIIPLHILLFANFLLAQDPPVADGGDDITVSSGCNDLVILDGTSSSGDNLDFLWNALNCTVLTDFDEDTLIFEIPQTDFDYDYYFSLTVTDGSGRTNTDTVTVTVLSDNIPIADAGTNFTACDLIANGSDYRVYLNGSNSFDQEDGTDIDYLWTVIDTGITIIDGQSTKSNPYFIHPVDLSEDTDFRIELMVTDGSGFCSGYDTVRVTCLANMCPLANAGNDFELSSGCNASFILDGSNSLDPEGESLNYNWVSLDGYASNIQNGMSDSATFNIPGFTVDKDLRFELTVSDGTNEDKDTLEVEFKFDEAPVANAGENISTNLISVILDGSGSTDDNLSNLDYDWTSLDDDGPSISSSNQPVATANFNESHTGGSYQFELEVDDGYCSHTDTVTIAVLDNMRPIAEAGDNFALSGGCQTNFYLDGTDSDDPEGEILTYLWSVTNELSAYLSNTNSADSAMFTINDMAIGEKVTFYLTVTDLVGLSHMDSVAVTILDDTPPVADAGVDFESCEYVKNGSNYRVYLNGSGSSDIDGSVKFKWTQLDGIDVNLSSSQSRKETPYFNYPSGLTENSDVIFQLRVYDSEEYCEDFDTLTVTLLADKCPTADAGEDMEIPSGCNSTIDLISENSYDPEDSTLIYSWTSLDGYTDLISKSDSDTALFTIPNVPDDMVFTFVLSVSDGINFGSDSVFVSYILNDAPVAVAGSNITTCEFELLLNASRSYDINKNELSYSWESLDGLSLSGLSSVTPIVSSPIDLESDSTYRVVLEVNDGYCSDYDTLLITIADNICPIADAGETVRIPKFSTRPVKLNAGRSFDPDSSDLVFEWTTPTGLIITDSVVSVEDLEPNKRYSRYIYTLKVMDEENSISEDSVEVIFSNFSPPEAPAIYAVADHNRVLVSWDATSESSVDSLTGYADFEGYKLYRSTDGGITWGGDEDRLYDFNGHFVGWKPFAQFDLSSDEDRDHCIYDDEGCESGLTRDVPIYGLDPLAPRFSLGYDSGIEYSFVDSNVIDGVKYSYTVTAYDIGFDPFDLEMDNLGIATDTVLLDTIENIPYSYVVDSVYNAGGCVYYSIISQNEIIMMDTIWTTTNPDKFLGPDSIIYFNEFGDAIRKAGNPNRGYYSLESAKGDSSNNNFITVVPGYTALDISFPDASNIEALFKTSSQNIGTGLREYFIVDRTKIVQDQLIYEIQAGQGTDAMDGMACEDPYVYGYVVTDTVGTPLKTKPFVQDDLGFLEEDSISGLPGTILENGSYLVPQYDIINPVGQWSNQFKGIRFKIQNTLKLNPSSPPDIEMDSLIWTDSKTDQPLDSATVFALNSTVIPELSYTNIASYKRRLNSDYMIEFFDSPVGDSIKLGEDNNGPIYMYTPFRITNLFTNKKVGLNCNDFGSNNDGPQATSDGAGDYVWTRGEDILMQQDTIELAGEWESTYNYNLKLDLIPLFGSGFSRKEYDELKSYDTGDTVSYKQMSWVADLPVDVGVIPLSKHNDIADDGQRNNPWSLVYPWVYVDNDDEKRTPRLVLSPQKFFVDGDNWFSDMAALGKEVGIADSIKLDTIQVVPNPYKASSRFNESENNRKIRFTHLPKKCRISVYTLNGEHVTTFDHEDEFDGNAWWNLRSGNNQDGPEIAPGLYFYIIQFYDGVTKDHIGKFAVVR
mgnify:CR=1 FL=1